MATPTTRRSSASKPAPARRTRRSSTTSTTRSSKPLQDTGTAIRIRRAVVAAAVAGVVTFVLIATGSLSDLWPTIPVSALLPVLGSAVMKVLHAGRAEQHAEAQRLADLERAARHQSLAAIDAMSGSEFERFVAGLCHRDGFTVHQNRGGAGDLGADVIAIAPDGRRIVIQCKRYKPGNPVPGPDIQRFLGTVRAIHNADVPVFVTTAWRFTKQCRELATSQQVVLVDRDLLSHWNNGINLDKYLPAAPPEAHR